MHKNKKFCKLPDPFAQHFFTARIRKIYDLLKCAKCVLLYSHKHSPKSTEDSSDIN